ncbi:hypothetical protein P9F83_20565 [Peribacillus psychrosaccharolyticus]|uniref:hypothetical protein n=1 Tax=Peribacillus psychrosaccharolyticus TaxID=1407 RepID=UPI0002E8B172|nr:hypothetical protein [Peribacillus psychrosaccharolyticus]MEC2057617.1 hypothetical protein [Peribacillus psychrosaccharolyticus]MED3744762.1 hypothetical protein [Peribacillus psychrosaccharolyticus]
MGFGVFRALSFSKLLPATGILRQLSLGILGGSGAVGFTLLQGSLHYLFTGDSTYLKEAVTWENLLFNLAFGAVMGPLAAKLFSKPGVNQVIKGPGKWRATILAKKTGKPIGAISSAISSAWQTVKATASISAISSLLIGGFDSFKQYKQNGEVDWKKTGQRTAMIFTTTLVFGVALGLGPKFMMKGCACDDPQVSQVQQSEKSVNKGTGNGTYQHLKDYKNNKYFTRSVEYNAGKDGTGFTYKVYQRGDINWNMIRTKGAKKGRGLTNAEASAKYGLAPILDAEGSVATLHHSQQKGVGPLYEASTRYHNISNAKRAPLHPYKGKLNPFYPMDETTRGAFQKVDSINYWKIRGEEALGGK